MFSGDQDEFLHGEFDRERNWIAICKQSSSPQLARDFDLAARWHAWRGRHELEDRYLRRAAVVRQVVRETQEKELSNK